MFVSAHARDIETDCVQSENPAKRARAIVQAVSCSRLNSEATHLSEGSWMVCAQVTHFNNPKILADVGP